MDISDIHNTLREQFNTLNVLPPPVKHVTIFQTIRMALQMVRSSMKDKYNHAEGEIIESVLHMIDRNLHMLMVNGNFVELDIVDSSEELSEELSEEECNVCNSKEKRIDAENFSEKNKEESGWASSITSDDGDTKEDAEDEDIKDEDTKDEDTKEENVEPYTPLNKLFYFYTEGKINYGGIEDPHYLDFLDKISKKNIYTHTPNKLYEIMEMNRESAFDVNKLKMCSTFKLLLDKGCEQELIDYYS